MKRVAPFIILVGILLLTGAAGPLGPVAVGGTAEEPVAETGENESDVDSSSTDGSEAVPIDLGALEALCDLWSAADVAAAVGGVPMSAQRPSAGPTYCSFKARKRSDPNTTLTAALIVDEATSFTYGDQVVDSLFELMQLNFPDAAELEIAGLPALRLPLAPGVGPARGWRASQAFLFLDPATVFQLAVTTPRGVDPEAALVALAQHALDVAAGASAPMDGADPPTVDEATIPDDNGTILPDGDRSGIPFPAEILGQPVEVMQQSTGPAWLDALSPPPQLRRRLVRALDAQGRALGDLELEIAQPGSGIVGIIAFRVEGADVRGLMKPLFDIMPVTRSRDDVDPSITGGKEIIPVDDGGNVLYAYPQGDVLWLIAADTDEDLSAVLEQLP